MEFAFTRAYTALVFILIEVAAELVPKEFEGNVYLADAEDKPTTFGVLKVYTQGEWNLVCYRMNGKVVMNNAAAATACRQLGHPTVIDGGLQPAECKTVKQCAPLKAISGIRCPEVADYSSIGEIFLLRCDSQEETVNKTNCDDFAEMECDTTDEKGPYNGQIQILEEDDALMNNLLKIYLEKEWRPVCVHKTIAIEQAADSACRQLGYTESKTYKRLLNKNLSSWKINDASLCGTKSNNISFSCFTDCINKTAGYVPVDSCEDDYILLTIICEFNKSNDGVYSAGNEIICTYQDTLSTCNITTTPCNQTECHNPNGLIAATVIFAISTAFLGIILIIAIVHICNTDKKNPAAEEEREPLAGKVQQS